MKTFSKSILSELEKILNRGLDNVYLNTALKVFLVLYAALAAPRFPPKLVFLMDNVFVRIGISFLIVFMALRDPSLALMIAVVFIITLQTANKLRLINTSLSSALPGETSWLPSAQIEGFAEDSVGQDVEGGEDVAGDVAGDVEGDVAEDVEGDVAGDPQLDLTDKNSQSECERCAELIKNNTCRIVD
jgi:hypothetical protein